MPRRPEPSDYYVPVLTRRERQCLLAVWDAGSAPEAAAALGLSPLTVKVHLQNARAKLGVNTTLAAIRRVVDPAK